MQLTSVVQHYLEIPDFVRMARNYGFTTKFTRLLNFLSYSKADYVGKAVFRKDHPKHNQFIAVVNNSILQALDVDFGNMAKFVTQ